MDWKFQNTTYSFYLTSMMMVRFQNMHETATPQFSSDFNET